MLVLVGLVVNLQSNRLFMLVVVVRMYFLLVPPILSSRTISSMVMVMLW